MGDGGGGSDMELLMEVVKAAMPARKLSTLQAARYRSGGYIEPHDDAAYADAMVDGKKTLCSREFAVPAPSIQSTARAEPEQIGWSDIVFVELLPFVLLVVLSSVASATLTAARVTAPAVGSQRGPRVVFFRSYSCQTRVDCGQIRIRPGVRALTSAWCGLRSSST